MLKTMLAAGAILAAFCVSAYAQAAQGTASQQTNSAPTGDFTQDNLKFHRTSAGFMQVVDTVKSQNAGTVIFPPGAAPVFAPMPGYDIKSAYEKHMSGTDVATAKTASAAKEDTSADEGSPAAIPATSFDPASKTVNLPDGRAVTFVDNDNLKVQMPGAAGTKTYDLHFHKASAGGFIKGWAGREQSRVGGSLGGGGVTMSLESQDGMPGGEVYDTAKGTVYGNSGFVEAKAVTATVREAVDVVKNGEQPDLAKLNVVKSLLSNNLGM